MSISPVTVTIESLGGLGDGIASLNGKPLFVPKACAGDQLSVRIVHQTKEALRGEIVSVEQPGPDRATAPCLHFDACGGCTLQQLSEESYREFKTRMAESALRQAGFPDIKIETIFLPAASRRRAEFKFDGQKLAYFAARTNDLVPIDNCLILEPALAALMKPLARDLKKISGIKTVSLTAADSGFDLQITLIHNDKPDVAVLDKMAETLGLSRIGIRSKNDEYWGAVKRAPVTMHLGGYDVALPPDAFLQASSEGQKILTDAVLAGTEGAKRIVDLFCGIGTYSFPLSARASTHAVELDAAMIGSLKKSIKQHNLSEKLSAEERDLFRNPLSAKELNSFDAVVINPPRIGAKSQCEDIAASTVSRVVMVSCNPATFARDAKTLKDGGFRLESTKALDQFVYSPHLEMVAVFSRIPA